MKNQEKDLKNENSDNTERKLTKEELTALCRRAKKHAQKFQPETIQHNTGTQYLLRTKQNTGHPCLRQMIAQTVRIYHSQQNTDDQRTKG